MTERATLSELHEFANAVREAGGGNPIDALMPAVPEDTSKCLIARNLNFNCEVMGADDYGVEDEDAWVMATDDREVRNRIAKALHLRKLNRKTNHYYDDETTPPEYAVLLPKRIGKVAADFDRAGQILNTIRCTIEDFKGSDELDGELRWTVERLREEERALALELAPYVESSKREARKLATLVNPDGSIVL